MEEYVYKNFFIRYLSELCHLHNCPKTVWIVPSGHLLRRNDRIRDICISVDLTLYSPYSIPFLNRSRKAIRKLNTYLNLLLRSRLW